MGAELLDGRKKITLPARLEEGSRMYPCKQFIDLPVSPKRRWWVSLSQGTLLIIQSFLLLFYSLKGHTRDSL